MNPGGVSTRACPRAMGPRGPSACPDPLRRRRRRLGRRERRSGRRRARPRRWPDRRRAQVEHLAPFISRGERARPRDLVVVRPDRHRREVRAVQQLADERRLEGPGFDRESDQGTGRSRSPSAPPNPSGRAARGQSRRGPASSPYARVTPYSSESVRPVSRRRWPSASCARQTPTRYRL
jgi:hypothetical protein